jgi:hypothetical protein
MPDRCGVPQPRTPDDIGIGGPPRCSTCEDLSRRKWHDRIRRHYINKKIQLSELQKSAQNGCPACSVIRSGFEHFAKDTIGLDEDHDLYITNWDWDGRIRDDGLSLRTYPHPLSLVFHVGRGKAVPGSYCWPN